MVLRNPHRLVSASMALVGSAAGGDSDIVGIKDDHGEFCPREPEKWLQPPFSSLSMRKDI